MKAVLNLILAAAIAAITGCGGSSDGEGSGENVARTPLDELTPDTVPEDRKYEFELYMKMLYWDYVNAVSGLYKVELNGDVSYYNIPTYVPNNDYGDYYVTAYNFLGDEKDNSKSCYLPAMEGDLNFFLNTGTGGDSIGTQLQYKNRFVSPSGNPEFIIATPAGDIVYQIDIETKRIRSISYDGIEIPSGVVIDKENNLYLSGVKEKEMSFANITSNLCSGLPASRAPKGFAGVYDVSTDAYNGRKIESYLLISEDGTLQNWKYMGDGNGAFDTENCYESGNWHNRILNNQHLLYNEDINYLFYSYGPQQFRFYLDEQGTVVAVGAPEPGETYVDNSIDVSLSTRKASISEYDLKALECKR